MVNEDINESISNVNKAIDNLNAAYDIMASMYGTDDMLLDQIARDRYSCENLVKALSESKEQAPIEG